MRGRKEIIMNSHTLTSAHITAYARFLLDEERASATVEKYIRDIRSFASWLEGREVSKDTVVQWKSDLLAQDKAPSTVNGKLSALNGLFGFLGWDDRKIKFLKLQKKVFRETDRELTREEYRRLLETARCRYLNWLELLMETICSTGIRVSEVRYITVEAVRAGRTDICLKGKIRTILLPGKLCRKLLKYARKQKITSGQIFLSRDGTCLSRHQIWRAMKALCAQAKVDPSKVFPHNLRHLFAVTFYQATHDIAKLADVLGHSSINTSRIYLLTTCLEHARQPDLLGLVV